MKESTRRRIRNKVAMKFRRKAEELKRPKDWKTIEINGKKFEEALAEAYENYEEGKEPLSPEEAIETFKAGLFKGEKPTAEMEKDEGEPYALDPSVLRLWNRPSEEEREREIKEIAREFNEKVEEQVKKSICRVCKSSPCRCRNY